MNGYMRTLVALALTSTLVACTPVGPVAPSPVDPNATPESACTTLAILGCGESAQAANGASCPDVLRKAMQLRNFDLACIASAVDVAAVRACGGAVRCRE